MDNNVYYSGLGMGGALAMILSWAINHSIAWCIVHGILGWFYVLYFAISKIY